MSKLSFANRQLQGIKYKEIIGISPVRIWDALCYPATGKFRMKGWIIILRITQNEALALHKKGIAYGENGLKVTTSRHTGKHYYLTESRKNIVLLNKYRNGCKVK